MSKGGPVYGTAGHPEVPDHIKDEINSFDPNIWFMFSEYRISKEDGHVMEDVDTKQPFRHPRWHFWYASPEDGIDYYMFEWNRDGEYAPIDRGVIDRIKGDLVRRGYSLDWILQKSNENTEERQRKKEEAYYNYEKDYFKANEHYFTDAAEGLMDPNSLYRDKKIISYPGQENRGTSNVKIPRTDKEVGLEKGDLSKILDDFK